MINPNEFLGMTTEQASVKPPLIPVDSAGYLAQVDTDGIGLADFVYKKGERQGQTGYRMTVRWRLQDPGIVEMLKSKNRQPVTTQSIMLNFTDQGALAAENPGLRALREAVNQNADGKPWQPAMLIGQMARIYISHRIGDNGEEQEQVDKVTKA